MQAPSNPTPARRVLGLDPRTLRLAAFDLDALPGLRPIPAGTGLPVDPSGGGVPRSGRRSPAAAPTGCVANAASRESLSPEDALVRLGGLCAPGVLRTGAWLRSVARAAVAASDSPRSREGARSLVAAAARAVDPTRAPSADPSSSEIEGLALDVPFDDAEVAPDDACAQLSALGSLALAWMMPRVEGALQTEPGVEAATFTYRQRSFTVPRDWLLQYLCDWLVQQASADPEAARGLVSSAERVIGLVWSKLQAAAEATGAADRGDYEDLLGCFNAPGNAWSAEAASDYFFWTAGAGAALRTHGLVCRLVHATSSLIGEPFTATTATYEIGPGLGTVEWEVGSLCDEEFGDFCRDLLRGRERSNRDGSCTCALEVHYHGGDVASGTVYGTWDAWVDQTCCTQDHRWFCAGGFPWPDTQGECTLSWSELAPVWVPELGGSKGYFNHGILVANDDGEDVRHEHPYDGWPGRTSACAKLGNTPGFAVHYHGIDLAYTAFIVDWLLFVARVAIDFGDWLGNVDRYDGRSRFDYHGLADDLGRYALCAVAERGKLFIHELGHAWLGGGHCEHRCCFEIAALHWRCRVSGLLGLPHGALYSTWGDDDEPTYTTSSECKDSGCPGAADLGVFAVEVDEGFDYSCTLHDPWSTGGASTTCVDRYRLTTWVINGVEYVVETTATVTIGGVTYTVGDDVDQSTFCVSTAFLGESRVLS